MRHSISALLALSVLFGSSIAAAATYSEATNGDLSGNRLAPTSFALDPGANTLTATSVAGDLEYYRVTIPAGHRLSQIIVVSSNGNLSFIAVQPGATFTEPPTSTVVGNLLGYSHFGNGNATVGTDILDNIGTGSGSIGFTGPLAQAEYTFWTQETGGAATTYQLNFVVQAAPAAVPVPPLFAGALAAGLGALGVLSLRRRRAR